MKQSTSLASINAERWDIYALDKTWQPVKLTENILLHSVSIAYKKVAFLDKFQNDARIIKGSGLLYGIFLLEADNDIFIIDENHSIIMDQELGVIIKNNKKSTD